MSRWRSAFALWIVIAISTQSVVAKPQYTAKHYNPDVMTVGGQFELPIARGSRLEGKLRVGSVAIDPKIVDRMNTDGESLGPALKQGLEKSLKNYGYLAANDIGNDGADSFNFSVTLLSAVEEAAKVKISVRIDVDNGFGECSSATAIGSYTALRPRVFSKSGKFMSALVGLYLDNAREIFSKPPEVGDPVKPRVGGGEGQGLSPYSSDDDTRWYGFQKAMQMAISNYIYQIRPGGGCNTLK